MKKFLVCAMLFAAPGLVMAQKGERRATLSPQERAEKKTAQMDKVLSLTPDQRQKIAAENRRAAEAMQPHINAIRAEKKAMREIGKQRRQAYASILTPEQMERLKAARKNGRVHSRRAHGQRMAPGRAADMQRNLPNE